jgi:hypothetical protein
MASLWEPKVSVRDWHVHFNRRQTKTVSLLGHQILFFLINLSVYSLISSFLSYYLGIFTFFLFYSKFVIWKVFPLKCGLLFQRHLLNSTACWYISFPIVKGNIHLNNNEIFMWVLKFVRLKILVFRDPSSSSLHTTLKSWCCQLQLQESPVR